MQVKIISDSTCDLSPELLERYDIAITPLCVIKDGEEFHDGVNITPADIFAHVDGGVPNILLELSDRIVEENHLTTMMVTHNMNDAITHGNRLVMMNAGKIIFDVEGEEKKKLTIGDLLEKFETITGEEMASDKLILSK